MSSPLVEVRRAATMVALAVASIASHGSTSLAADAGPGDKVKEVFVARLPNVPGKSLTAVVVSYEPGGKSGQHHHAGSVFAYVLSGAIRSKNSATGSVRIYRAGESFLKPPASAHLVSENASTTEPASLLAVFVADGGATLTTFAP